MRQESEGQGRSDVDGNWVGCGCTCTLAVLRGRTSWHSVKRFLQQTTELKPIPCYTPLGGTTLSGRCPKTTITTAA